MEMVLFSRDAIAKALILATVSKGEKYRENAIEAAAIFEDHELHQDYYRCIECLKSGVQKKQMNTSSNFLVLAFLTNNRSI